MQRIIFVLFFLISFSFVIGCAAYTSRSKPQDTIERSAPPTPKLEQSADEVDGESEGVKYKGDSVKIKTSGGTFPAIAPTDVKIIMDRLDRLEPTWNFWTQENVAGSKPTVQLSKEDKYKIIVHLSAFAYKTKNVLSESSDDYIKDIIEKFQFSDTDIVLKAIIAPDPDFFEVLDGNVKELKIEKSKIIEYKKHLEKNKKYDVSGDILADIEEQLKKGSYPDYVLGHADFKIKPIKATTNKKAKIAIAFWHNDHPLKDVLTLQYCIGKKNQQIECGNDSTNAATLSSVQAPSGKSPQATLHLFKIDEKDPDSPVMGIFKNQDKEEYKIWKLFPTYETLVADMTDVIKNLSKNITDDSEMIPQGKRIFDSLFVGGNPGDVSKVFITFVRDQLQKKGENPVIHIRFYTQEYLFLPMQIMVVSLGEKDNIFLGSKFAVEMPLPKTFFYKEDAQCIADWIAVIPKNSGDNPIENAIREAGHKDNKESNEMLIDYWLVSSAPPNLDKLSKFKRWLEKKPEIAAPTALVVLSHHDKSDRLYVQGDDSIYNSSFYSLENSGNNATVAILNVCEGSAPSSARIVETLNRKKFGTIITTSFSVDGRVAGHFFKCFDKNLDEKGKEISIIFKETMDCLRSEYNHEFYEYFMYQLLGNGHVSLCKPRK